MSDLTLNDNDIMYVVKRNGDKEEVSFDKVTRRIKYLSCDLKINANSSQESNNLWKLIKKELKIQIWRPFK